MLNPLGRALRKNCVAELRDLGAGLWTANPDSTSLQTLHRESIALLFDRLLARFALDRGGFDARQLGTQYEHLLEFSPVVENGEYHLVRNAKFSNRKSTGSYYTPDAVVQYIVAGALGPLLQGERWHDDRGLGSQEILELRIVDPAMGAGHFLTAAAEYLFRAYREALVKEGQIQGVSAEADRLKIVENCIYGLDIDPIAAKLARFSLWMWIGSTQMPEFLDRNLKVGDALRGDWPGLFPAPWSDVNGAPKVGPGFDAAIGNPPYLSFSGRQRATGYESLLASERAFGNLRGWASSHGLFILHSLDILAAGGFLSFIVPDQVGHLERYGPLRAHILEQAALREVRYWGDEVFDGVATPALTLLLQKTKQAVPRVARIVSRDGRCAELMPAGSAEWFVFPYGPLIDSLAEKHKPLTGYRDFGVHTGNVAGKLIFRAPSAGLAQLLEGRQVFPFRCESPRAWLDSGYKPKGSEYCRLGKLEAFNKVDILLRQTAGWPIAARHVHGCHIRNSLLALTAPAGYSIEFLLGVLNSNIARWLYQVISIESGQKSFPQVKLKALRKLPIPDPNAAENRVCAEAVETIVLEIEAAGAASPEQMAALDATIALLYGLDRYFEPGETPWPV